MYDQLAWEECTIYRLEMIAASVVDLDAVLFCPIGVVQLMVSAIEDCLWKYACVLAYLSFYLSVHMSFCLSMTVTTVLSNHALYLAGIST
jgi:hypothetical protein